jgi:hypothetical protein
MERYCVVGQTLFAWVLVALATAGCTKPPPPMVVTLKSASPNGSEVVHTVIKVHPDARKLILNMELLNPANFESYRATLTRGAEKIDSADGLKMAGDGTVRMDLDADLVSAGSYAVSLEGADKSGKFLPIAAYTFEAIK